MASPARRCRSAFPTPRPATSPQARETLNLLHESLPPALTRGQVARTLDELCELGLLEKFKDAHRITRYRPSEGRKVV
jgi:hypothetical protein